MTDLVERLREPRHPDWVVGEDVLLIMREAADEIERLRKECERLLKKVTEFENLFR